ncbi:MAG: hypothetical protein DRI57_18035 [Deltaproteobacteria bacterium]|nr:MAG: hypothetical protein DRI57_18035 [Deltaproteobacteria bacterium]
MEFTKVKNRIQSTLEKLPPGKLEIALTFLEFLEKTGKEESRKFLLFPGFVEYYQHEKNIRIGKVASPEVSNKKKLEEKHRKGYMEKPVQPGEFSDWEDEQIWPDQ